MTFRAHINKLNQICFNRDDRLLLSSGRDNAIRMWDLRKLCDKDRMQSTSSISKDVLMEYSGHKCTGYNIAANFFGYEDFILTGSEDSYLYIYNKLTGRIERKIKSDSKISHLVRPLESGS